MLSKIEITELITKHWEDIEKFGVKKLWLFGSYVKENQREKGDIDILWDSRKERKPSTITWISNSSLKICLRWGLT